MHVLTPILCGHWDEPSEQAAAPSAEGFLHTRRPADQASQTSQGRDNRLIRRRWSLLAGRSWLFKMNRDMEGEGRNWADFGERRPEAVRVSPTPAMGTARWAALQPGVSDVEVVLPDTPRLALLPATFDRGAIRRNGRFESL